jgi:two-component system LytT family response regulator
MAHNIRTLVVDDEALARKRLVRLLGEYADIEIAGEAENGSDALLKIEASRPDLLLLDVQMPDLDGFEVLRALEERDLSLTIFVTAYDQYAIQAFEVNAIDYLLKPVTRKRLDQAMARTREKLATKDLGADRLSKMLNSGGGQSGSYLRRLPVRTQNRILIINIDEITSLHIDRGLVYVTTSDGERATKYTSFGQFQDQLDPAVFMRVHRQSIVNLNAIREITAYDNNTARLILTSGHEVIVSRAQMKNLRGALQL